MVMTVFNCAAATYYAYELCITW